MIEIYSNSWGPSDVGFIVDRPGTLMEMALKEGVTNVINSQHTGVDSVTNHLHLWVCL